ncbi:MAG: DUF3800 domain-containing protein [Agriterribacter sp.]
MDYYLFLDETGDHGLTKINPDFPIFLLCGVLVSKQEYFHLRDSLNSVKQEFWGHKQVIFHSRDIRKCEKEFKILLDLELKRTFYERLDKVLRNNDYTILACGIKKNDFIKRVGKLSNDVYELCLSFLIERAIFNLEDLKGSNDRLYVVLEERGKAEDIKLSQHFQRLKSRGTGVLNKERLNKLLKTINFRNKKQNINGLQVADLVAYPIANYILNPNRANPAYEVIEGKIYSSEGELYGLKIYPTPLN